MSSSITQPPSSQPFSYADMVKKSSSKAITPPSSSSSLSMSSLDASEAKVDALFKEAETSGWHTVEPRKEPSGIQGVFKIITGVGIEKIKFSQDSIGHKTRDNILIEDLIDDMAQQGWKSGSKLEVVRTPTGLVALNNRRLYAAKIASKINENLMVHIQIFPAKAKAPDSLFRAVVQNYVDQQGLAANINHVAQSVFQESYLHCIKLRMHSNVGELDSEGFGYKTIQVRQGNWQE
jgi:hypothetical protein